MARLVDDSADLHDLMRDACDDIIDYWGKDCLLLFPPLRSDCPNCLYNSVEGRSANRYQAGGPFPFADGDICPYCEGRGWRESQTTSEIKLRIAYSPNHFFQKLPPTVQLPEGVIQTKGYLTDLPAILQAGRLRLQTNADGVLRREYVIFRPPQDIHDIIQGRYFTLTWTLAG
jgi:hypothetical protein